MSSNISIVFFGSGPVAAKSLELLTHNFTIEAVITKPRPAHHKGDVPVLTLCEKLELPVFTATNKANLSQLFASQTFASNIGVVIDFGIIISRDVIDYFPFGIVNSHFSLLPELRGADPITFSILSGQPQTGVSLMLINDKMDEGELLSQTPYDLPPRITTPQLTDKLIKLSDTALKHIIPLYLEGNTKPAAQEDVTIAASKTPTYSRKLSKADGGLDFTKPAVQLEREIRAFIEWPRSHTRLGDKDIVITNAHVIDGSGKAGNIWRDGKKFGFYTSNGILVVDKLKPTGKQEMTAEAFIAGYSQLF